MDSKKKIYIAGCGGMLGEAFYKVFNKDYELKSWNIYSLIFKKKSRT